MEEKYEKGARVTAQFVGANPRNNLRLERSYAVVEKLITRPTDSAPPSSELSNDDLHKERTQNQEEKWEVVRDDKDWHLVFRWRRTSELLGTSEVEITWETADPWAEPGRYRIRYFGDAKSLAGQITEFEGVSGEFELVDDDR